MDMPAELPPSHTQWQHDNHAKKQQRVISSTACALCKGLKMLESPLACVQEIADTLPSDTRAQLLDAVDIIQSDAAAPLGHALRYLSCSFNELSFKRHEVAATTIKDKAVQQQVRSATLGFESFFKEYISPALAILANRQQQDTLTSALRQGNVARTPRRDRDRHQDAQPFRGASN